MGSYRSKEDDVAKISTTVFVTNFPESLSAKKLFHSCKTYGHVVDSFISTKRRKTVRGLVLFNRNSTNGAKVDVKGTDGRMNREEDRMMSPAAVLDDGCLMTRDLSKSILGRVKEFASLANLKMALCNEGFVNIKIQYMGEFWVMIEFDTRESSKKFRENVSVGSWFSIIKDASLEFYTDKRIAWVEVEGIPFKMWSGNTFNRIAAKWGDMLDVDDQEDTCFHSKRLCVRTKLDRSISEDFKIIHAGKDGFNVNDDGPKDQVPRYFRDDSEGEEGQENIVNKVGEGDNDMEEVVVNEETKISEDPFNIYPILNKIAEKGGNDNKSEGSLKYPPRFSPEVNNEGVSLPGGDAINHDDKFEPPRTGGSILGLLDEVVKIGQVMGYKMEGCMSNMAKIIETQGAEEKFMMIAVYAPHDAREKCMLWDYLQREIRRWKGEVVVMGDFNEVRYKSDRLGSVFNVHDAYTFNSFILNSGLVEVELGGCAFTWCHKFASKMSKLDRFLVSESFLNTCPNVNAITLERYLSDHRPILLREAYFDYGPTPFKIFHYWFEMEGFNKMVGDAWKEYPGVELNAIRYFQGTLKYRKNKIRVWNIISRSSVTMAKTQCKNDLEAIDKIIDSGNGGEAVKGDENSSFFHGMLKMKRNMLNVRGVMIDEVWVDNPERVKREFFEHFKDRFCQPGLKDASIQMEFPYKLSEENLREVERDVTNDEIKRAVWDCGIDKAPGPDGFTFGFFRRFWDIIQFDVFAAVTYFFSYCDFSKGSNSSFIALIPKVQNANLVKEFRPISLIGSLYKIIAKILANRLVGVLSGIVNEVQSAFIADRQILDGPFILNEVVQWCKSKKKQAFVFKVDFEKAYNSVRWDFLDEILRKFGFRDKWCKWIQCCLWQEWNDLDSKHAPLDLSSLPSILIALLIIDLAR
nr:RNA-directed DNA polymerase, eukaryota [Tanacetum cinerariifolium]